MKVILTNEQNYHLLESDILEQIGDSVLNGEGKDSSVCVVGVFYVDADAIQTINKEYRGKDKPTDVITFRLMDNPENLQFTQANFPYDFDEGLDGFYLGEIFICEEIARMQAGEYNHSVKREVAELFVHGMLHILGYDHEIDSERQKMKAREVAQFDLLDKLIEK